MQIFAAVLLTICQQVAGAWDELAVWALGAKVFRTCTTAGGWEAQQPQRAGTVRVVHATVLGIVKPWPPPHRASQHLESMVWVTLQL
jgi:hypothetical protein